MRCLHKTGPAKGLLSKACRRSQTHGLIVTGQAGSSLAYEARGGRQYATKRINPTARTVNPPSPPRSTAMPSSPAPSRVLRAPVYGNRPLGEQPARLVFSAQDIPPLQEWLISLDGLGNKHLTPLQCVDAARRYVSIATQYESQWRPKLENEHDLPPGLLHWIGVLLVSGNTSTRWRLGTHMLRSASELGYAPSTLSLVRIFTSMPSHMFDKAANTIMFRTANARFQEVLKAGADPNALTLQGIIHAKSVGKGSDLKALAAFSQATEAWKKTQGESEEAVKETEPDTTGNRAQASAATSKRVTGSDTVDAAANQDFALPPPREPRWDWEASCILGQANILVKNQQTTEKALELFKVAALELDNPHGFYMLAKLMGGPRDSPERRAYLLKAAISGETDACRDMGELEALAAERRDLSQKERTERDMLSKEWFRLADGEDVSAFIKSKVGDQVVDE